MSLNKFKVYISIPAYDGKMAIETGMSLLNNIRVLEKAGYQCKIDSVLGDCYIENARNKLCKSFLASDADNMIFVDNDLSFDNNAILKLLSRPVDIIGGAYPFRNPNKPEYPVSIVLDDNDIPVGDPKSGIIKANFVPTGLMRITRKALETMKDDEWLEEPTREGDTQTYRFFRQGLGFGIGLPDIDGKKDMRWIGEDVFFCTDANNKGIQVWCDPRIAFEHFGKFGTKGCFHEYLIKNGTNEERQKAA
jgi:hypothetical protein